jgi:APA family basic amino acid/polyamine antiporter
VERPFKSPLNITIKGKSFSVTAFIGAIMTLSVWLMVIITKPDGRNLGLLWIAFGLVMYFIYRRKHRISPVGQIELEKIKIPDYKELDVTNILLLSRGHLVPDTLIVACNLAKKFGAEISLVNIIEVPYMIPLTSALLEREAYIEPILKKAQAFALEKGVRLKTRIIRARSIAKSAEELVEKEGFDLLIIGNRTNQSLGPITEKILASVKCRVWICRPED